MRILHTSDWHAGKKNGNISRKEDLIHVLGEMKKFIISEKIDCVIVCGDIFDKPTTPPDILEVVWDFFLELNSIKVFSLIISGNHDSQDFLKSMSKLLQLANVKVFANVINPKEIKKAIFQYEDKNGEKVNFAVLPYPSPNLFARENSSYEDELGKYIELLFEEGAKERYPIVFVSHLFVSESTPSGTEKEISVLTSYSIRKAKFPQFSYCALGHIHKSQKISTTATEIVYCGSPYQIDFGEREDENKGFYLIEISHGVLKKAEFEKIDQKRVLRQFEFDIEKIQIERAIEEMKKHPKDIKKIKLKYSEAQGIREMVKWKTVINSEIENVVSIDTEEKTGIGILEISDGSEIPEGTIDLNKLLDIYHKYFVNERKRKEEDFLKVREKLVEIMHKSEEEY